MVMTKDKKPETAQAQAEFVRVSPDGYLEIRMKLGAGVRSSSGKSLVVASTRGFVDANGAHKGKTVRVGLNAFIKD